MNVSFIASITDSIDGLLRRLFGKRLCAYCGQWAKQPYRSGGLDFCDRIHASVHFKKQEEAMKTALQKKLEADRPAYKKPDSSKPAPRNPRRYSE
ncbi:MAG TPA: hypothetical protein VF376_00710 [Thermoanaerobaculia bacterium]